MPEKFGRIDDASISVLRIMMGISDIKILPHDGEAVTKALFVFSLIGLVHAILLVVSIEVASKCIFSTVQHHKKCQNNAERANKVQMNQKMAEDLQKWLRCLDWADHTPLEVYLSAQPQANFLYITPPEFSFVHSRRRATAWIYPFGGGQTTQHHLRATIGLREVLRSSWAGR